MNYKFNKEKLDELLKDFYDIAKITMSVWDANHNQITFYPKPMASICARIKSCPEGKIQCLNSDIAAFNKAKSIKDAYTFTCHAGLVDTVVPIFYADDIIAYIMFGQIKDLEQSISNLENVKALCKKYNIDDETVEKYYQELPLLSHEQITALSNLFKKCVPYFYENQLIKIENNELAIKIDNYITQHLSSSLSVNQICDEFCISVNLLYSISHKFFGTSIKDYITHRRIEESKHYLTTTHLPVSEISAKVGFSDYNYYIRVFKARVGHTPLS